MSEEWRPIKGFEDLYLVSNHGRVKSIRTGLIRKLTCNKHGYYWLNLWRSSKAKAYFIQTLVTQAFLGDCPAGQEVNHKDGDKSNNYVSNLEYNTPKQNIQHSLLTGLRKNFRRGEDNPKAKLTKEIVGYILQEVLGKGRKQRHIAKELNIDPRRVNSIVKRRIWRHIQWDIT